ncbi:MAG: RNA methyltransferase [Lachnospiraceae bacterium]|nr:RNA methyltransferase [Lachnospiraceae bacterium]
MISELPEEFKKRMMVQLGNDYPAFEQSFEQPAVRAFSLNTAVISVEQFESCAEASEELKYDKIPGMRHAYYYDDDMHIGRCAYHHAGMIYSQDPAAMLVAEGIELPEKARVLDLCAAPGGKSVQLAQKLTDLGGILISNEPDKARNSILCSNIERMGFKNVAVTCMYPEDLAVLYPSYFDAVLVDAPCSGEGMFRKYPESVAQWSPSNIEHCAIRQKDILRSAVSMVKPGGTLVYSTCTYAPEEDEEIADFIRDELGFELIDAPEIVTKYAAEVPLKNGTAYRFYPHVSKGEGQFMAYFQKPGELDKNDFSAHIRPSGNLRPADRECFKLIEEAFNGLPDINADCVFRNGETLFYLDRGIGRLPEKAVTKTGVCIGSVEKKRFIPHHDFFSAFGCSIKNRLELSPGSSEISAYLHGEELRLSQIQNGVYSGGDKGFGAVTVLGVPLGGFKLAGGRLKNHYPKGLRNL